MTVLSHRNLLYFQPALLYLFFHDAEAIFVAYFQREKIVFDTHHSILLGSNRQWSTYCIVSLMEDVQHAIVHW